MTCTRETPCGGLLKTVLVATDFILEECIGSAHSYRTGAPALEVVEPERGRYAHLDKLEPGAHRRCGGCGKDIEKVRGPGALFCCACAVLRKHGPRPCWYCAQSKNGPCSRHGGPPPEDRDRIASLAYYHRKRSA
jgi:hypothetical protein